MAYRFRLSQFLCSRRFDFRNIALSLLFLCFCCVFCRRFAVSFVATPPLLRDICVTFAVLHCCVVCTSTYAVVCVTFSPSVRLYLGFLRAVLVLFEVECCVFLVLPPLLPLWCCVFWLLVGVWFCVVWCWSVGCCFMCCVCIVFFWVGCLVVWLCPRFCWCCCFVCGWLLLVVCLLVVRCVVLLLLVLFCFGLVRCFVVLLVLVWLRWSCSCCVSCAVGLLVGCGGCVALSAFLLLVVLLVWFWFVCCSPGGSWW